MASIAVMEGSPPAPTSKFKVSKRFKIYALGAVASICVAGTANAAWPVIDVRAIAQAIQTARNTLTQLQEARSFYDQVNSISSIRDVAGVLDDGLLRGALPEGMNDTVALVSSDLSDLGAIGQRAESILANSNFSIEGGNAALGDTQSVLERAAQISARDQAYGEYMLESTQTTGEGLSDLNRALASSTTLRQSQDIEARATIENASVNNRILQMMAARQAQEAAAKLRAQEEFARSQQATLDSAANGTWTATWNGQ